MKLLILLAGIIALTNAADYKTCDRKLYTKYGCYKRDPALFPDMLLNGRYVSEKYMPESGLISWGQYKEYIHSLTCECAEKAKEMKYAFFAIGFYGECFGGQDRVKIGMSLKSSSVSTSCINGDYNSCGSKDDGDHECAGVASHEYVYSVKEQIASDDTNNNVNGGYSDWSEWTTCDQSCGEGLQVRERSCNNPMPKGKGQDCEELGESSESKSCKLKECPVAGGWTKWNEFSECTASCNGGMMTRKRTCTNPPPANGGAECSGSSEENETCGTIACPVDGKYGAWSSFSKCTASCGGGTQRRERKCDSPAPDHGGQGCQGSDEETQSCNNQECPVDGGWTTWGAFSACDKDCGYGLQKRSRSCTNPPAMHGGKACEGNSVDSRSCIKVECPVNGKWSAWSSYSSCSKTCDGGRKTRTRKCDSPAPLHNGQQCPGQASQTVECNKGVRCPFYTAYGTYTACEGNNLRMWCTDPVQKIKLQEYWYGRQNSDTCGGLFSVFWSTSCKHDAHKVYTECQNKSQCTVKATNRWMGKDPCFGTHKYFYVKFRCYG